MRITKIQQGWHIKRFKLNKNKDSYFESGATYYKELTEKISLVDNKEDDKLYHSERNGPSNFGYFFPNLSNGKYVLILNFVESYQAIKNQRVFDINFGFTIVVSDLDVFATVGRNRLLTVYLEFDIRNEQVIHKVRFDLN